VKIADAISKLCFLAFLLACLVVLTSCSTVTKTESMTPDPIAVAVNKNSEPVALMISGEARGINIDNFKQALADALISNQLFSGVGDNSPYLLEVVLHEVTQPMFGGSFTVTTRSTWKLFRLSDREMLWTDEVNSSYSGGMEGGLVGANRLRVATEGAARENISSGIGKLAQVDLDQSQR
jgi:hypothetical protein